MIAFLFPRYSDSQGSSSAVLHSIDCCSSTSGFVRPARRRKQEDTIEKIEGTIFRKKENLGKKIGREIGRKTWRKTGSKLGRKLQRR